MLVTIGADLLHYSSQCYLLTSSVIDAGDKKINTVSDLEDFG